jgi:hypothetical protein
VSAEVDALNATAAEKNARHAVLHMAFHLHFRRRQQ